MSDSESNGRTPRRTFLQWTALAGAGGALVATGTDRAGAAVPVSPPSVSAGGAALPAFNPLRAPAVPLAVRSPYLSVWLAADNLPGTWPSFWTGHTTAMTGIASIDGTPYVFMGAPALSDTSAVSHYAAGTIATSARPSRCSRCSRAASNCQSRFCRRSSRVTCAGSPSRSATSALRPGASTARRITWRCTSTSPASGRTAIPARRSPGINRSSPLPAAH